MDKLVLYKADDGGWRWRERIITDEGQEVWQDAPVLRVELVFNGTPAQFGVNAQAIERQLGMAHTRTSQLPIIYVCVPDERDKKPEANRIVVCFQDSLGPDVPIGYVVAEVLPDGKSWLSIFAGEDHWPRVAECWQFVRAEMERRGWQFYAPSDRDLGNRWKEPGDQSEEGTLVKHKTFFLDTSADYFVTWLRDYTRAAPYRDFPTEKGRINLQSAQPAYRPAGPTEMVMDGFYIAPSGDDSERGTHLHRLISFKIVPLAHGRTEVTAECSQPAVTGYFQELMTEIGRRWPESGLISGQTHSQAPASKPAPSEASADSRPVDSVNDLEAINLVIRETFYLSATPEQFREKLEDFTRTIHLHRFPTHNGCYYILEPEWETLSLGSGLIKLKTGSTYIMPPFEDQAMVTLSSTGPLQFEIAQLAQEHIKVTAKYLGVVSEELMDFFRGLLEEVKKCFPEASSETALHGTVEKPGESNLGRKGPTIKTQERAKVFKKLKDAHPEWSYDKVAMEACEELSEFVTGETVRNVYRSMREAYPDQVEEWTWKRSDRIR